MRIGILGSGLMGGKLGTIFARAGHEVIFSYARTSKKLEKLARESRGKARAGTPAEAAQDADALLLAVHWSRVDDVLKEAGDLAGKVIISPVGCTTKIAAAAMGSLKLRDLGTDVTIIVPAGRLSTGRQLATLP